MFLSNLNWIAGKSEQSERMNNIFHLFWFRSSWESLHFTWNMHSQTIRFLYFFQHIYQALTMLGIMWVHSCIYYSESFFECEITLIFKGRKWIFKREISLRNNWLVSYKSFEFIFQFCVFLNFCKHETF